MKKSDKAEEIPHRCEYCIHNTGEGERGYMWKCEILGYCNPFGWHRCEAEYLHKGKFETDIKKYEQWEKNRNK